MKTPHPVPRFKAISRPRVTELLSAGLGCGARLLVVQAPQGYGKTTVLSLWDQERRDLSVHSDRQALRRLDQRLSQGP